MGKVMRFVRELLEDEASKPGTKITPVVRGSILHAKRVYMEKPEEPVIYAIEALIEGHTYFDMCVLTQRTWTPKDGDFVAFQPSEIPVLILATPIDINAAEKEEKAEADEEETIEVPRSLSVLGIK